MRAGGVPLEAVSFTEWKTRLQKAASSSARNTGSKRSSLSALWGLIEPMEGGEDLQRNDCSTYDNSILLESNAKIGMCICGCLYGYLYFSHFHSHSH